MSARRVKVNCGGVVVQNTVTLDGKRVVEIFYGDADGAALSASGARQVADALLRASNWVAPHKLWRRHRVSQERTA